MVRSVDVSELTVMTSAFMTSSSIFFSSMRYVLLLLFATSAPLQCFYRVFLGFAKLRPVSDFVRIFETGLIPHAYN